jgi:hypothetical protein
MDRRSFFRRAGAAGLGALALGAAGPARAGGAMPARPLGRTGAQVPILSLGTMWDTVNNQIVLRQALALGVTHWDTAASYQGGNSEVGIGNLFARFPDARAKVFLVTKASYARSTGDMTELLTRSLAKLQTDYVDLYFVHGIGGVDELFPGVEQWAAREKAAGRIRLFGFSTHRNMAECLQGAAGLGFMDAVMFSYNHRNMHSPEMERAVAACHQAGVGLIAMKTQGGGPVAFGGVAEEKLAQRFLAKGYTPEQVKLKAVWTDRRIAGICSQMPDLTILKANAAAALDKVSLTAADRRALAAYGAETAGGWCAGCAGLCEPAMGRAVPVAEVMRSLMYQECHGRPDWARELLAGLEPAARRGLAELDFAPAEAACPQGLAVGELMRRAAGLLA